MPDKTAEEKANLAKKLAEQRAKGAEGIPTTAKVKHTHTRKRIMFIGCIFIYFFYKFAAES